MLLTFQIILLAAIAFFDFKDRSIPVIIILGAFMLALWNLYQQWWIWPEIVINILLVSIQLVGIASWLKIKNHKISFFKEAFGLGDALLLCIAAFYFTPIQFMVFIVVSACICLCWAGLSKWIKKQSEIQLPLAGVMAIVLIVRHIQQFVS